MRRFFEFRLYHRKLYLRIGRFIFEAGWYAGESPGVCFKVLEWFPHAGEIVLVWVQMAKAILCVSWDYGR